MTALPEPLRAHLAEVALVAGGLMALGHGAARQVGPLRSAATSVGIIAAVVAAMFALPTDEAATIAGLARTFLALLAIAAFCVAHSSAPRPHYPEQVALLLFSTTGMLLLASADDLLTLFIALELAGLPLVALTALGTTSREPAGAALRLFLVGALASALMLFGISLIYGATGSLSFTGIAGGADSTRLSGPLCLAGTLLLLGGIGFKLAAAPLHLWAPEVYQHGSMPAVVWIATGSKVAGFTALIRLLWLCGDGLQNLAAPALAGFGIASLLLGNIAALPQRDPRRMLAYSAIGQAGYLLVTLAWGSRGSFVPALFYVALYSMATLAAFAAIAGTEGAEDGRTPTGGLVGLGRRAPATALALLMALVTLAGLPPLPGFLGKFLLFRSVLAGPGPAPLASWIVALGVALSAVSFYYYLMPLKQAWVETGNHDADRSCNRRSSGAAAVLLGMALLLLGLMPGGCLRLLEAAVAQTISMQSP